MKPPLYIRGMHGIGDNLHQRAVMRLLKETHNVTLETSWHSLYHDLIGDSFRVVGRGVNLRTQQKNYQREKHLFADAPPHHHVTRGMVMRYVTGTIAQTQSGTIVEALFRCAGLGARYAEADFRWPLKQEWLDEADRIMASWPTGGRPIMIYRPLCVRPEWLGSRVRNANVADYRAIADRLHQKYFAVTVADLEEGKEWIVDDFAADLAFLKGEFPIEILAAIMRRSDLVLTSGGMAAMLGPAVETPTISVLGGYEPPEWCADSGKFSPFLCISPNPACRCGSSGCTNPCSKKIDLPAAFAAVDSFTSMTPPVQAPAIKGDTHMLELPSVTLLCVETQMHELSRIAIEDCAAKVKFGEIVIHTDKPEAIAIPGARYVQVPNWPVKEQCGHYCYNQSHKSVNTPHMIFMEWDGGVRNVEMWAPEFLEYDYIGAPWPGKRAGQWTPREGCSVGNGGFTLWSKKLMDCVSAHPEFNIITDTHISINHRRALETHCGARWASEPLAFRFSFEHGNDAERAAPSFGIHDVFNWPLAFPREEVVRRASILMQNEYVRRTSKLHSMFLRAPYLQTIPGYEAAMMEHRRPNVTRRAAPPQPRTHNLNPRTGSAHALALQQRDLELQRRGLKA